MPDLSYPKPTGVINIQAYCVVGPCRSFNKWFSEAGRLGQAVILRSYSILLLGSVAEELVQGELKDRWPHVSLCIVL